MIGADGDATGAEGPGSGRDVGHYTGVTMRETEGLGLVGRAEIAPRLRGPDGGIRTGALLTMLDNVGGLGGGLAALPDGWVVTTNLAARVVASAAAGPLRIDSSLLRRGRNSVLTEITIHDEGARDTLVASGVLTSAILVPEFGVPQWDRPVVLDLGPRPESAATLPAMREWLGVRPVAADAIEIDIAPQLRNPWGILHGGVLASLVDFAAEHATDGGRTTDVVLHFLAPNRIGPVRARARVLGRRSDGQVVRIEVRDEGADRTTALAIVTAAPPPARR